MEKLIKIANRLKLIAKKLIFLIGLIALSKLLYKVIAYKVILPLTKRIAKLFKSKIQLNQGNPSKFVIVYGACTKVGRLVAKVICLKFGYSVFLID